VTQTNFEILRGRPKRKGLENSDDKELPNRRIDDIDETREKKKLPQVGKRKKDLQKEERI
jgi:hypothetical protein